MSYVICLEKSRCSDPSENNCSPYAFCTELGDDDYTCKCRDGYEDVSEDPSNYPGRVCEPFEDKCNDLTLKEQHPNALCTKVGRKYIWECKPGYYDASPDPMNNPGEVCVQLIDECKNPQNNNCSRYAKCIDKQMGYTCECLSGYYDNNPEMPGRLCTLIVNECEYDNMNDCHPHATCTDQLVGYNCSCKPPFHDMSPDPKKPGRICQYNECLDDTMNDCDSNAECQDTDESYICFCKHGFMDEDPTRPGRKCAPITTLPPITTPTPCDIPCGRKRCCSSLGEVCLQGECACPPGYGRNAPSEHCVVVDVFHIPANVIRRGSYPLVWTSSYAEPHSATSIDMMDVFLTGLSQVIEKTPVRSGYITSTVLDIANPKTISSQAKGLVFKSDIEFRRGSTNQDELCHYLNDVVRQANYTLGSTELRLDPNFDFCEGFKEAPENLCGDRVCDKSLNEICLGGKMCGCAFGKGRRLSNEQCVDVMPIELPLWVIREGHEYLTYNRSVANMASPLYQHLVKTFTTGFTVYFPAADSIAPAEAFDRLMTSVESTDFAIGNTDLYINDYQPPFSCYRHNCDKNALLIDRGDGGCACKCREGYVDADVRHPGMQCNKIRKDLKNPEKIYPSKPHGLLFNTTFAVSPGSITKEEFCQRLIEEIRRSDDRIDGSQLFLSQIDPCST
ncbi:unnamed protein product [Soboliphyme baturini]|uniref:EGF-like domain-containing protein n=1 Tax=Soboliphyme baturini TaxID=241478 RepID=A0A183J527_9BILA|nr:unnamed protein product [Soboliphyme baturini]